MLPLLVTAVGPQKPLLGDAASFAVSWDCAPLETVACTPETGGRYRQESSSPGLSLLSRCFLNNCAPVGFL